MSTNLFNLLPASFGNDADIDTFGKCSSFRLINNFLRLNVQAGITCWNVNGPFKSSAEVQKDQQGPDRADRLGDTKKEPGVQAKLGTPGHTTNTMTPNHKKKRQQARTISQAQPPGLQPLPPEEEGTRTAPQESIS